MRLLPPCGKASAAGGPPNASPPFLQRRSPLRGEGRPKKVLSGLLPEKQKQYDIFCGEV